MGAGPVLLELRGISKSFPGVRAVQRGELELRAGEIHALVGENGAGKSTLVKVLAGALAPDSGEIRLRGESVRLRSPIEGSRHGVAVIYQEFNLVPALSVRENLFLGQERSRAGMILLGEERRAARRWLGRLGHDIDPETPCGKLSVAEQQLVEIAKALAREARVLVMDEPTAALSDHEVTRLFDIARELRAQGLGIIYVSHRLDEIFALCDRITIMRDGEHIATLPVDGLEREHLIELMVGRKLDNEFPPRNVAPGPIRLGVQNLRRGTCIRDVSFCARGGEVVGFAGLVGAGRTELARLLFGADLADSGTVSLDGKTVSLRHPRDAIQAGIGLLTEDRKQQGLVLGLPATENFALPNLRHLSRLGWVRQAAIDLAFSRYVDDLRIRVAHPGQLARQLSGGNQQKIVLAKWLEANSEVVIFDEPTRGVDVGAKWEIYQLINELAARGKVILMISSELPELLGMSDRILVMRGGQIHGEITDVARATQADVLRLAAH